MDHQTIKTYSARVKESDQIDVAFKTGGQIEKVYVRVGQRVKQGQLLAKVESSDYELMLRNYEVQYNQLQTEVERLKTLYENRSISQNDYEKATAGLEQLSIAVEGNRRRVEYTNLYAPVSGVVVEVNYTAAELVDAGMTVLTILAEREMKVFFDMPLHDYQQHQQFINFRCRLPFMADTLLPLGMESITPRADNNQLCRVTLTFKGFKDSRITSGMAVSVVAATKKEESDSQHQYFTLPLRSLGQSDSVPFVWVVTDEDRLVKQEVTIQSIDAQGQAIITSGISGNERIVRTAASSLLEGEKVRVLPTPSPTNVGNLL